VRGVQGVRIDTRAREAVVTRCSTQAQDPELLRALQRTGYPGRILPTREASLRIQGLQAQGAPERARSSLLRVSGVRNVEFKGTQGAQVTYDPRKVKPEALAKALQRAGLPASLEG